MKNLEQSRRIFLKKWSPLNYSVLHHFSAENVEPLKIPESVAAGTRITVDGYDGTPDVQLNPKKKVWEKLQADLKTNDAGVATWQGNFLLTADGQQILSSLANVSIK